MLYVVTEKKKQVLMNELEINVSSTNNPCHATKLLGLLK